RGHHADAHVGRVDAAHRRGDQPAVDRQAELLRLGRAGPQHHRRPVVDTAGVAGRHQTVLFEYRPEPGQALGRGVRPHVLVGGEVDGLLLLLDGHGHDLAGEALLAVGLGRELVAAGGVGVAVLPGDAVPLGDVLRGDAHVVVVERVPQAVVDHVINDLGVRQSHAVAVAALGKQEGRLVHVLDPAGQHHLGVAEGDLLGSIDDRLQPGAAHPVEGQARRLDRDTALHPDLAAGVHALTRGQDVTDDHLVDARGIDTRTLNHGPAH